MRDYKRPIFLNKGPIFNPKPALESSEPQLLLHGIRFDVGYRARRLYLADYGRSTVNRTENHNVTVSY